ncbi:hypothetical protein GCM10022215_39480 [Nocardioides fonticola]|uniref:Uncharacterized protein n=1 Tax=Nocardioides fonticola TaxID=450363 RepID=A0ABP7XZ91_9ACTN
MTTIDRAAAPVATGRATLLLMIPLNLLLVPWVWIGRLVFGVFGWFAYFMLPVALIVAVAMTFTTILAFTQKRRPRSLSRAEVFWQWSTWAGLLALGTFLPDFGDTEESYRSALTQAFGYSDSLMNLSYSLSFGGAVVAVVAWIGLVISLLHGHRQEAPSS